MQVICLEEKAFYELVEQVVARLKEKNNVNRDKWVSNDEAMRLLNIKIQNDPTKIKGRGESQVFAA